MEILLLDNRVRARARLNKMLKQAGYTVNIARDLDSARLVLEKKIISIVLARWEMPAPEEAVLAEWLRLTGKQEQRYILFLVPDEQVRATDVLKVGGDDLLICPVDEDEMVARLLIAERVLRLEADLRQAENRLDQHVMIDELTGLMNQRALYRFSSQELARARRSGQPLSLLAIALDNFNDSRANDLGNKVLAHMAVLLRNSVRPYDQLARWSGTEFLVILPDTDIEQAAIVGERVLEAMKTQMLRNDAGEMIGVDVSVGLHTWKPGRGRILDFDRLVREAERAMRHAKQGGSNRLEKSANRVSA